MTFCGRAIRFAPSSVTVRDSAWRQFACDAARAFREEEHPRGKGEHGGEFVKKGSGSGAGGSSLRQVSTKAKGSMAGFKKATQLEAKSNTAKFRAPKSGEKVPAGWTNVRVNPDPNGDIRVIGLNSHGNETWLPSKSFSEKQKAFRQENWPAWTKKLPKPIPPNATNVLFASGPQEKVLAVFTDSAGNLTRIYSAKHTQKASDSKYRDVRNLDKRFPEVYERIQKDLNKADSSNTTYDHIRQNAQIADLMATYGIRPGGGKEKHTVVAPEKRAKWPKWAQKMEIPKTGSTGASELESKHVVIENGQMYLRFLGKHALPYEVKIDKPEIRKWLAAAKKEADNDPESQGFLFTFTDYNSFKRYCQGPLKMELPYNFRTRVGCSLAQRLVEKMPVPKDEKERKAAERVVGEHVAARLNNTRDMALKSYIDPKIFSEAWD